MHTCEECGQACYCDMDDTELPIDDSEGCSHRCEEEEEEELCLWTGKDDAGNTRYCFLAPTHAGAHRDSVGFEWTSGAPHPSREPHTP